MQEEKFNKQDGNLDQPNVNESLALAGLLRKVSADERHPTKTGLYHTNRGMINYFHGLKKFEHDPHIDYWLEEIEFSSDAELTKELFKWCAKRNMIMFMETCLDVVKWMKSNVLAATAKDNVR